MIIKKDCVAMLLAGGQGSRLGVLTRLRAKPGVPFGGKYRIIDFTLSNCINSGIDTVGVLTQYQPLELNTYIGTGSPWDLDGMTGGAFVLPPYISPEHGEWYLGTANAIHQNAYFLDKYDPEYVLVLSGDHIYKMDYARMLDFHIKKGADLTIAVIRVPMEDAPGFGIMNTDEEDRIVEFEEKPKQPKSDLASMGVYVFNWKKLREYLERDSRDELSQHDFGKNVIPAYLSNQEKVYAYAYEGYWRDVGTIESLWQANMELLGDSPQIDLYDENWKIYSRNPNEPPHYVGGDAVIRNSIVSEGCTVYGRVENSILFSGVTVSQNAFIKDSIVMPNCFIAKNAEVTKAILDEYTVVMEDAKVGSESGIAVLGTETCVKSGAVIPGGAMCDPHSEIDVEVSV